MGNEKERFVGINCKSGDESLLRSKMKVRVESELFKEFLVTIGVHQESVFSPRRLKLQGK